jgi:hypothetical protein
VSYLTIALRLLAFEDDAPSNAPRRKTCDEDRYHEALVSGRTVAQPVALAIGETKTFFDASRSTGIDDTTQLALSLSPLSPDRYRLKWTTVGTNPAFRVERAFGASGNALTFTVNSNATVTVTGAGPTYTNVTVGDTVLIPGLTTGEASAGPFNFLNVGYWTVLGRTSSSLTLARPSGEGFSATAEVVTPGADQFLVFASAGVQVGDTLELSAVFAASALRPYTILAVAPKWVDLQTSTPIAAETAIPTAAGVAVYSEVRTWTYVDTDQRVAVRYNGETTSTNDVEPIEAATKGKTGFSLKRGRAWKCVVVNKATAIANVAVTSWP